MDWKNDLYAKIAPHIAPNAIVASNTSGLSMNAGPGLPADAPRFCGIHFFNPPRYMHLVEIIATRRPMAARWMRWKPG
jgi:3-hydroxyacyl-CoA dehydrogenase